MAGNLADNMRVAAGHWASINESGFVVGMRLMFWICRVFGRWPFRMVLHPVLAWYVLTKPAARRASRAYLRKVGAPSGLGGVLRHFGAFGEAIMDKMLLWGGLFDTSQVRIHGLPPLQRLMEEKRGAVLVCSHLGNADLSRVLAHQQAGLKLTVLVHTRHAKSFNEMLARIDPRSQMNLMQVTEMTPATAMLLAAKVEQGEFVVIAGDRIPVAPQPRVALAPFLGSQAAFPVGPSVLASVLQCPLFLLFSKHGKDGYEIHFEALSESVRLPRKGRDEALAQLAGAYAQRLEEHCRRAPLEWFNFYDFWLTPPGQE